MRRHKCFGGIKLYKVHKCYSLLYANFIRCLHMPTHSTPLHFTFWSVCAMRLAHCNLLWMRFKFFLFVRMFCELVQNHFMISASFWAVVVYSLSLSLSVMILFLQQHKSPKEIQENETVAHLALNAFCCGWQLCQTSFVYHMYALLYHMICILCVCVCWNSYLQNSYFSFIYFRSYKL